MRTLLLAAILAAGCGAGNDARAPELLSGRNASEEGAPSTCTFGRNAKCGSTDCCEFASTRYPGYREEYVCCGGTGAFVDRICSCPGCKTPCGFAGALGCAICGTIPFSVDCNVHPEAQPGEPHACGYVLDGNPGDPGG